MLSFLGERRGEKEEKEERIFAYFPPSFLSFLLFFGGEKKRRDGGVKKKGKIFFLFEGERRRGEKTEKGRKERDGGFKEMEKEIEILRKKKNEKNFSLKNHPKLLLNLVKVVGVEKSGENSWRGQAAKTA